MRRLIALSLAALLVMPAPLLAQSSSGSSSSSAASSQQGQPSETPQVDASRLGVDLSRIRRELNETPPASPEIGEDGLRLRYTVEVVGTAPRIDFFQNFPLTGPVPYGGPTHQEVLSVLTPKEYSSPVIPFYSLAAMAAKALWQHNKKKQCEKEIEEYRQLVMQGVPVAAPRCTQ